MLGDGAVFFSVLIMIIIVLIAQSVVLPTPINDMGTTRYRGVPYMTLGIIIINGLVFMVWQAPPYYQAQTIGELQPYVNQLYQFGYRETLLVRGESVGALVTFTSMFMHADFWHLLGNMIYLWAFGRRLEDACGSWRFLLYYLTAGMLANFATAAVIRSVDTIPGIGASGAIAGVMGGFLVLFPNAKIQCLWGLGSVFRIPYAMITGKPIWKWLVEVPAWFLLVYFAIREALPSLETIANQSQITGVNNVAHFAGFLAALLIFFFTRKDLLVRWFAGRRV